MPIFAEIVDNAHLHAVLTAMRNALRTSFPLDKHNQSIWDDMGIRIIGIQYSTAHMFLQVAAQALGMLFNEKGQQLDRDRSDRYGDKTVWIEPISVCLGLCSQMDEEKRDGVFILWEQAKTIFGKNACGLSAAGESRLSSILFHL